jgi:hypothetical protein
MIYKKKPEALKNFFFILAQFLATSESANLFAEDIYAGAPKCLNSYDSKISGNIRTTSKSGLRGPAAALGRTKSRATE